MNKRLTKRQKIELRQTTLKLIKNKSSRTNIILSTLFFTGLILTIFEINIYHDTIIDWKIPTAIWFFSGLLTLPFTSKYLVNYYSTTNIFMQLVFTITGFGGLLVFSFMAINYYFSLDSRSEIIRTEILKTGHLAKGRNGCGNPYADVIIKSAEKELIFPCDFDIEKYKFVTLTVKRGLLGFDIVLDKKPSTE